MADVKSSVEGGPMSLTEISHDCQLRRRQLSVRFVWVLVGVAGMCSCHNPDRYMRHDETRNSLRQLANVIVAIHERDPQMLDKKRLHDILSVGSQWGLLSIGEFECGHFEKDAWGNQFGVSYTTTHDADVFTIVSCGPNHMPETGAGDDMFVRIVFKDTVPPEITIHEME